MLSSYFKNRLSGVEFKDTKQALEAFAKVLSQDLQMIEIVGESYLGQFTKVVSVKKEEVKKVKKEEVKEVKKEEVKKVKKEEVKKPKKTEVKTTKKYNDGNIPSDGEISEMKKPDLIEVISGYKLNVKISQYRSLIKLQTAVSKALDEYEDESVEPDNKEVDKEFNSEIEGDFDVELGDVETTEDEFDISKVKDEDISEASFTDDDFDDWD